MYMLHMLYPFLDSLSQGHLALQVPTTAPQLGQGTMAPATQLTSLAPGAGCPSSCGPTMPTGPAGAAAGGD